MPSLTALKRTAAAACLAVTALVARPIGAYAANGDTTMFTLDHLTFVGNQRISTDTLNAVAGIKPGDKVNRDSVVNAFNNVTAEYGKENVGGSIQPTMALPRPGHMNVTFTISELAPPVATVVAPKLAHETFTGNVKVSGDLLMPALTIKPGDDVTRDKLVADLNALGAVYKGAKVNAAIQPVITKPTPETVDVNFAITENPPKKE